MRTICVLLLVVAVAMGGAIYFVYHLKQQPLVVDVPDPVLPDSVLPIPVSAPKPPEPKKHFITPPKWSDPVKLKR